MASWPTGIETIKSLLAANSLQKVAPSREAAQATLDAAAKHLDSAQAVAESDPDGAYTLLYDAARKGLAAMLQTQGLRSTSRGGHYAVQEAISAQFTKPPPRGTRSVLSAAYVEAATKSSTTTSRPSPPKTWPRTLLSCALCTTWHANSSTCSPCSSIDVTRPTNCHWLAITSDNERVEGRRPQNWRMASEHRDQRVPARS
jgi:hypothetical protein